MSCGVHLAIWQLTVGFVCDASADDLRRVPHFRHFGNQLPYGYSPPSTKERKKRTLSSPVFSQIEYLVPVEVGSSTSTSTYYHYMLISTQVRFMSFRNVQVPYQVPCHDYGITCSTSNWYSSQPARGHLVANRLSALLLHCCIVAFITLLLFRVLFLSFSSR